MRKKNYIQGMEQQIAALQQRDAQQAARISELERLNAALVAELDRLRHDADC